MKLVSLKLTNFQGEKARIVEVPPGGLTIYGENAAGKTTLFSAYNWVFFGKDSQGKADFEIKTIDPRTGEPLHRLSHEVEAVVDTQTDPFGEPVLRTFKKAYKEVWTKQRGSAVATFDKHVVDHWVDDAPLETKREYEAKLAEIIDPQLFRILSDPSYFCGEMHWSDRRKTLVEVCGDVSGADIIAADKSLERLPEILGPRSPEEHKKSVMARRKEVNGKIDEIPTRIDEASRALKTFPTGEPVEIVPLKTALDELQKERSAVLNGGSVTALRAELTRKETARLNAANEFRKKESGHYDVALAKSRAANTSLADAQEAVARLEKSIDAASGDLAELTARRDELREKVKEIDARVFVPAEAGDCPTCGRPLPADQVDAANEEALRVFHVKRAVDREDTVNIGKAVRAKMDAQAETIEGLKVKLDERKEFLAKAQATCEETKAALEALEKPSDDFTKDPVWSALDTEVKELGAKIAEEERSGSNSTDEVDAKIKVAESELEVGKAHNAGLLQAEQTRKRITDLEKEEKGLAEQFGVLEEELAMVEAFIRAKAAALTDKINSKFTIVTFKLFDEQINGGLAECCDAVVGGVPWGSLNHGSRINAGLDVIEAISEFYGQTATIWMDFSESLTSVRETKAQQIRLVASKGDKTLRFEPIVKETA